MKTSPWDIVVALRLFPSNQGGRRGAILDPSFRCIMQLADRSFDVRLDLTKTGRLAPGQEATVPIRFLYPALALPFCAVGNRFVLRESRPIAEGVMEAVAARSEDEDGVNSQVA